MRLTLLEKMSLLSIPLLFLAIVFGFGVTTVETVSVPQVASATVYKYEKSGIGIVDSINEVRVKSGVAPVKVDPLLQQVANSRLTDMVTKNYYAHVSPDGNDFSIHIPEGIYACENLHLDTNSHFRPIDAWLTSKPHKSCLLHPNVERVGFTQTANEALDSSLAVLILSE